MEKIAVFLILAGSALFIANDGVSQVQMLDDGWHHFRNAGPREWSDFPINPPEKKFSLHFTTRPNNSEQALSLRQHDVKLNWLVVLNGQTLGALTSDEKDLVSYFKIPVGLLKHDNTLVIACADAPPDDINLGNIVLYQKPLDLVLSEGYMALEVKDADSGKLMPARLTITDAMGTLQTCSGSSQDPLAVRPGYVYTGNGKALLGLPAGTYKVYAGRGFEYGIDSAEIVVKNGEHAHREFSIKREVSTDGWASSDTHIHTFTWSRHGDATDAERMLTIAGEGIELPIITEHNLQIEMNEVAARQGVGLHFTPVTGNEVTTAVGHFNVFPVTPDTRVIDYEVQNWQTLSQNIQDKETKAIILNHARDIHARFRPFDPKVHLSSAGVRLDGWDFPANAMEVFNSGAQQTDRMELTRDWFGMLNHGAFITPVGSSDSHDVSRYIVGQARTYIRCNDDDPGNINVQEVVKNFREGNVMVSFGLLTAIEINDSYGPGELVPASDHMKVSVVVSGPAWTKAERVLLFANGKKIREEKIVNQNAAGIKWSGNWEVTIPSHDIFLVAVAEGPDSRRPFWPIARPYQPTSPTWSGGVMGLSGAVWLDSDKNGKRDAAFDYAKLLNKQAGGDLNLLIESLASYDESVSIQAAALLHVSGKNLNGTEISKALRRAAPQTKSGFQTVIRELQPAIK